MYYSKSNMVENRTVNYRFSIKERGQDDLLDLKQIIKIHNKRQAVIESSGKEPHYIEVRVRPRGPRTDGPTKYGGFTPDYLATHYDVYVVRNTTRMKVYHRNRVNSQGTLKSYITDKIDKVDAFINSSNLSTV